MTIKITITNDSNEVNSIFVRHVDARNKPLHSMRFMNEEIGPGESTVFYVSKSQKLLISEYDPILDDIKPLHYVDEE